MCCLVDFCIVIFDTVTVVAGLVDVFLFCFTCRHLGMSYVHVSPSSFTGSSLFLCRRLLCRRRGATVYSMQFSAVAVFCSSSFFLSKQTLAMSLSVCAGPDVVHVPKQKSARGGGRVYFLYKAAEHGCLTCVKQLVEGEGVDPKQVSPNTRYLALDYAAWGQSSSSDPRKYDDLLAYLREVTFPTCRGDLPSAASPEVLPLSCGGPDVAHVPPKRCGKTPPRGYYLYKAAEHGCLQCVRHLVETEGVDPNERSLACSYSAGDFARWGRDRNEGSVRYDEVIAYLDDLAPSGEHELLAPAAGRAQRWKRARELESENRLIGLDTPVPAGNGSRMMEKMGWQPGKSLGKALSRALCAFRRICCMFVPLLGCLWLVGAPASS